MVAYRYLAAPVSVLLALAIFIGLSGLERTNSYAYPTPGTPQPSEVAPIRLDEIPWLIVPGLPSDAAPIQAGSEIFRLVCRDCHGDRGQGLTADWIAQWSASSRDCWQSKCHVSNHPPEGFVLPRYIPPLLDEGALSDFTTALDLFEYVRLQMPWYAPGSLTDVQYWQVTAYLVSEYTGYQIKSSIDLNLAASVPLARSFAMTGQSTPASAPVDADKQAAIPEPAVPEDTIPACRAHRRGAPA